MTKHVNIGQAKTSLSALVAAAMRGEEIILDKAGTPQVRLVPVAEAAKAERERIAEKRKSAFGMYREAFKGFDTSACFRSHTRSGRSPACSRRYTAIRSIACSSRTPCMLT
jgi:prevent-host-death family protein